MFYNTGISTYVWIVSNRKPKNRKGKVQLIDASSFWQKMRKSLGSKRKDSATSTSRDHAAVRRMQRSLHRSRNQPPSERQGASLRFRKPERQGASLGTENLTGKALATGSDNAGSGSFPLALFLTWTPMAHGCRAILAAGENGNGASAHLNHFSRIGVGIE